MLGKQARGDVGKGYLPETGFYFPVVYILAKFKWRTKTKVQRNVLRYAVFCCSVLHSLQL